jgi:hypothetical protein
MIERGLVDGKPATIAYITKDFKPCGKHEADLCKVIFDEPNDQGIMSMFLSMQKNQVAQN